jgi:hypothetical protein
MITRFPIFGDFSIKSYDFAHNIPVTLHGPKCKNGSFCSIFHKLSEYCNLEITLRGKQGLLVIQYLLFTGNSLTYFRQKSAAFAQN